LAILETDRLILRRQRASDIPFLVDLWSDPEVTRHLGGPRDRDQLQEAFEETARDPFAEQHDLWPVVERETGRPVGHCGLLDKDVEGGMEIELIYILAESAWGQGYATEIAQALRDYGLSSLGIERLIALIEPGNEISERVATKVGMRFEREIRRHGTTRLLYCVSSRDEGAPGA
jgi:RimJ/RimL family protein N-acetyltransferase